MSSLDVELARWVSLGPAAAFCHRSAENHDFSETVILGDGYGEQAVLSR